MSESKNSRRLFDDESFGAAVSKASNLLKDAAAPRRLAEVVDALGRADKQGKGTLGYVGRRLRSQFAGFLVANRDRVRISATIGPYSELSEEESMLLADGHATLAGIVETAAPQIAAGIAGAEQIFSLYRKHGILPLGKSMLASADVLELINALQKTEPGRFLSSLQLPSAQPNAGEGLADAANELERRILLAGVAAAPNDLIELVAAPAESPASIAIRIVSSVMRLRAMLRNACQLLFQVSIGRRPPVLNEESIFDFHGPTTTHIGDGYVVDCQPSREDMLLEPGDLVLLDYPPSSAKRLCHLEHVTLNFSSELGPISHLS